MKRAGGRLRLAFEGDDGPDDPLSRLGTEAAEGAHIFLSGPLPSWLDTGAPLSLGDVSVAPILLLMLIGAAFLAGAVDALVGGGGLIQLPALLLIPGIPR